MAMCLTANRAVAQNYSLTHSSGTETITLTTTNDHKFQVNGTGTEYNKLGSVTVNGGTLNIVFDNAASIYLVGAISVTKGTLNLSVGDNCSTVNPTIMRDPKTSGYTGYTGKMIEMGATQSTAASCKVTIQGEAGKPFIIDGNCELQVTGDSLSGYAASGSLGVIANHAIIIAHGGVMDLDYVTLQRNWNDNSSTGNREGGGALNIYDDNKTNKCENIITMDNCVIEGCYAKGSGAGIRLRVESGPSINTSSMVMNKCVIRNCYSQGGVERQGGVIRTWGVSKCTLEMYGCVIEDNYNNCKYNQDHPSESGAFALFHWNAASVNPLRLDSCIFNHNWSRFNGGALGIYTTANITNCRITNNTALGDGGGIHFTTYSRSDNMPSFDPADGALELDDKTIIQHNFATRGGGLFAYVKNITMGNTTIYNHLNGSPIIFDLSINGATICDNTASEDGGGVYISKANDCTYQTSTNLNYGDIDNNTALDCGGGLYVEKVNVNVGSNSSDSLKVTKVINNKALSGAGFYLTQCNINITNGYIGLANQPNITTGGNGGGVYISQGNLTMNGGDVSYNRAQQNGGGIYMASGNVTMNNGVVTSNQAVNGFGGGLYLGGGTMTVSGDNTAFKSNHSFDQGGAIHLAAGDFTMMGGIIGGTTLEGNYTDSINPQGLPRQGGGGLYVGNGTANISGGAICGNRSWDYGGGIYINGGECTLSEGANIGGVPENDTIIYTNRANKGGGIYSAGGTITLVGGKIQYNIADVAGGGIYSNGYFGTINVQKQKNSKTDVVSYIEYNKAQEGGGIYANRGTVNFSDGYIQYNYASEGGGGIYINDNGADDYGKLFLMGSAQLVRNYVPTGKKGGGIYLKGVVTIGEAMANSTELGIISAEDNFAYTTNQPETVTITDDNRNNVYLPVPVVDSAYHKDVLTVIYNGISEGSRIGFSVPANYVPVIYCENNHEPCMETGYEGYTTSQYFLHQFSSGMEWDDNLFDDTERYEAVHFVDKTEVFDPDHVYLYGFWTNIVTEDPTGGSYADSLCNINTPEKLAYFISYVNGINDCAGHPHPDAEGTITANIDMSAYGWVPIGDDLNSGFQGILHGNGHTITGISSLLYEDHLNYGFIGKLNGGTVEDLFVKNAIYALEYKEGLVIGGLVGQTYGNTKINNCEASASISASHPTTIVGGLVGRTNVATDTIHSCIAIADMKGTLMGGLVGHNKGVLLNSFANAKFTYNGSNQYFGGLVGQNTGKVENCYVRLRGDVPTSNNFGWLVGENENGASVNYCYTRGEAGTPYYASNSGSLNGCGYYANNTQTPYLYARRDNQVTIADGSVNSSMNNVYMPHDYNANEVHPSVYATGADKQMMFCLNNWVSAQNADTTHTHPTYTYWHRPTTKVINDDLPVLRMPSVNAVACTGNGDGTENETFLNYGDVNDLIEAYPVGIDGAAIWLYQNKDGINGNNNSGAKLYIAEGVTVMQKDTLNAYVGVTLLNRGGINGANPTFGYGTVSDYTDWHMFSSPLVAAPLGVNYTDDTQYLFSYGHPVDINNNPMPYYHFYDDEANRGYFPSHRYGTDYGTETNLPTAGGNYYQEWDYYTYYEPEYHWINFKRNGNSHWHEDEHDAQIAYNPCNELGDTTYNETHLIQGRGYLLATREETFLQCYGTLNRSGFTTPVTCNGRFSRGYNFLGNPYLAYLDFNAFVDGNVGGIWENSEGVSYAIIDELPSEERVPVNPNDPEGATKPKFPAGYKYYAYGGSPNDYGASQYIAPHQGFMIRLTSPQDLNANFDSLMCSLEGYGSTFRGDYRPAYPLVNLFAIDGNNNRAITTVELGRPDRGGAKLMRELKWAKCHVYCHYEDEDWTIAFTQPGLTEVAIRFEAYEDGEFTMKWDAENGEFHYLHLIDNMTGVDVDCLAETEYRFTATTGDFRSRFRLVFGYTGIEEGEVEGQEVTTFAFQSGDELVVNGEGTLTMYDVTGRAMMNVETNGTQTVAPLPDVATGVYLLRLDTINGTKIQKIVIK